MCLANVANRGGCSFNALISWCVRVCARTWFSERAVAVETREHICIFDLNLSGRGGQLTFQSVTATVG